MRVPSNGRRGGRETAWLDALRTRSPPSRG
ncbi:MAG: hypothetical protein KDI45_05805 [Candidatus Accumulibacter sp.]|nr:hypothetical protein [Accumulibacter sp.]